jgi:hypothetical protein
MTETTTLPMTQLTMTQNQIPGITQHPRAKIVTMTIPTMETNHNNNQENENDSTDEEYDQDNDLEDKKADEDKDYNSDDEVDNKVAQMQSSPHHTKKAWTTNMGLKVALTI